MKKLFGDDYMLNSLGLDISESFSKMIDDWIEQRDLSSVDPIELEWIINSELGMRMAGLYISAATISRSIKH